VIGPLRQPLQHARAQLAKDPIKHTAAFMGSESLKRFHWVRFHGVRVLEATFTDRDRKTAFKDNNALGGIFKDSDPLNQNRLQTHNAVGGIFKGL
jgi:hypothetical protein